jgi:hypothetical protein
MCWSFDDPQPRPTYFKGRPDITWTPKITTVPPNCDFTVTEYLWKFIYLESCYLGLSYNLDNCGLYDLAPDGYSVIVRLTSLFPAYKTTEIATYTLTIAGIKKQLVAFNPFDILDDCTTTITAPTLANYVLEKGSYTTFKILAFSNSPVCSDTKTCTSDSQNVVWSQSGQNFLVKSLGNVDGLGTKTVTLICGMTIYTSTTPVSATFYLTIIPLCSTTTMIAPDLTAFDPIIITVLTTNVQPITPQFKD